jgi:hypothetical protein
MRRICTKLGFSFRRLPDSQNIVAEIELERGATAEEPVEDDMAVTD